MTISNSFNIGQELCFIQVDSNFEEVNVIKCVVEEIVISWRKSPRYNVSAGDNVYTICEKSLFDSEWEALDAFRLKLHHLSLNIENRLKKNEV